MDFGVEPAGFRGRSNFAIVSRSGIEVKGAKTTNPDTIQPLAGFNHILAKEFNGSTNGFIRFGCGEPDFSPDIVRAGANRADKLSPPGFDPAIQTHLHLLGLG